MSKQSKQPRIRAVPAVTRAIAILKLLGHSKAPLNLKSIAETLELVPSTVLHILRVLEADQLVSKEPRTGKYRLGLGLVALARTVLMRDGFVDLVQPKLDELADHHGVTSIGVTVPDADHMVAVAIARALTPVSLHVDVGSRFPALISATGRCLAAFREIPEQEMASTFRTLRWFKAPTYKTWRKEVDLTRNQGFAIDPGNYIAGVTVLAVPVFGGDGEMYHSIAAVGLSEQFSKASIKELSADLKCAANDLTKELEAREQ